MKKPEFVKEEHLVFLDKLRRSGITNMYGAGPYLQNTFSELTRGESHEILAYWMETFRDSAM